MKEIDAIENEKKDEEFVNLSREVVCGGVGEELNEDLPDEKYNTEPEHTESEHTDTEHDETELSDEFDEGELVEVEIEESQSIPDMEVHSEFRRNPVRGARESSEKALIRNQIEE